MRIASFRPFPVAWTDPCRVPDWAAAGRPVPGPAGVCTSGPRPPAEPAKLAEGRGAAWTDERRSATKERQGARREGSAAKQAAWREPASTVSRESDDDGRGDSGSGGPGPGRGRRGVPPADRAAPPRAPGALLPDARLSAGRRGRAAGDHARRLARPGRLRGPVQPADLAVPGGHQPLPERAAR